MSLFTTCGDMKEVPGNGAVNALGAKCKFTRLFFLLKHDHECRDITYM